MKDEFANRQNMHLTVLKLLENPAFQPAWKNQKPTAFTTRAAEFGTVVNGLTQLISDQQAATTGYAGDKEREEEELETLAHEIGQTLSDWFEENDREGDAAQIDLSLHRWQRLRDAELIAKARLLHTKLTAALAEDAAGLAEYGLTPDDATALKKETDDFERVTADPSAAISRRKALTAALRPKFRVAAVLLKKMDRLVPRLRRNPGGPEFAAAWAASRIIRDLGGSAGETDESPGTPEPEAPAA
ncbi:hypothetical protein [Haloferula sargassicola]|uniref:Uncharacterized protein n=1 Tax=Haloferula sargassicola TaxID=490096 RepID=A0ABP9UHI6_9BACT